MYRLELIDITKRYPGITADDGVSLAVRPGEIHAVLGENGAGKSTLMKIIYGMLQPDAGELRWNGERLAAHGPGAARAGGIAMVFQHLSLFDSLTVAQNVWIGRGSGVSRPSGSLDDVRATLERVARQYQLPIDPDRVVHDLSVGERQFGPNAHLASAVVNWAPHYEKAVGDALEGTWTTGQTWWGVKEGAIDLVSLSDRLPEAVQAEVTEGQGGAQSRHVQHLEGAHHRSVWGSCWKRAPSPTTISCTGSAST